MKSARRSRQHAARIANNLLPPRARLCAGATTTGYRQEVADRALAMLEIDQNGTDEMDKRILETIIVNSAAGPPGVNSLAVAVKQGTGLPVRKFTNLISSRRLPQPRPRAAWRQNSVTKTEPENPRGINLPFYVTHVARQLFIQITAFPAETIEPTAVLHCCGLPMQFEYHNGCAKNALPRSFQLANRKAFRLIPVRLRCCLRNALRNGQTSPGGWRQATPLKPVRRIIILAENIWLAS